MPINSRKKLSLFNHAFYSSITGILSIVEILKSSQPQDKKLTAYLQKIRTKTRELARIFSALSIPQPKSQATSIELNQFIKRVIRLSDQPAKIKFMEAKPLTVNFNEESLLKICDVILNGIAKSGLKQIDIRLRRKPPVQLIFNLNFTEDYLFQDSDQAYLMFIQEVAAVNHSKLTLEKKEKHYIIRLEILPTVTP